MSYQIMKCYKHDLDNLFKLMMYEIM